MQAFNALANGGSLIQPHIMKEVSHYNSDDTKVIDETYEPVISKNVLSDKSTATLRDYLERTVNEGGSNKSYIEGYITVVRLEQLKKLIQLLVDMKVGNIFLLWLQWHR